jgi:hypothetical protein
VPASVDLVEVHEVGVDRLDPAARGGPELAGERREADRNRDRRRSLAGRTGHCPSGGTVRSSIAELRVAPDETNSKPNESEIYENRMLRPGFEPGISDSKGRYA